MDRSRKGKKEREREQREREIERNMLLRSVLIELYHFVCMSVIEFLISNTEAC